MLDTLLHGRDSCRTRGLAQSLRIVLRHSVGPALDVGRQCGLDEPAFHDAARERQRGGASWASAAERCVDRYCCRRQPAVYLGAWTRAYVVAIMLDFAFLRTPGLTGFLR